MEIELNFESKNWREKKTHTQSFNRKEVTAFVWINKTRWRLNWLENFHCWLFRVILGHLINRFSSCYSQFHFRIIESKFSKLWNRIEYEYWLKLNYILFVVFFILDIWMSARHFVRRLPQTMKIAHSFNGYDLQFLSVLFIFMDRKLLRVDIIKSPKTEDYMKKRNR